MPSTNNNGGEEGTTKVERRADLEQ